MISVAGIMLTVTHLLAWSFIVIGTLSICGWLKSTCRTQAWVLYFVISVLGGLGFLLRWSGSIFCPVLLQLSLLLKLGLAPFQFWVFPVLIRLDHVSLCIFLGPLKVGLLWLFVNVTSASLVLCLASLFCGLCFLWLSANLALVLYGSGSCQLIIFTILGPSFFPSYLYIYLLCLFAVSCITTSHISPYFAFCCLGAIPPFTIFWGKFYAIITLPFVFGCAVILISLLSLWPYLRCALSFKYFSSWSLVLKGLVLMLPYYCIDLPWILC